MKLSIDALKKIADEYGESFYILDSRQFELNFDELLNAFRNIYSDSHIAYSYKTNYTPRLCSIVNRCGGYAEVVSDMEYRIALEIGVSPDKIIFNGPCKNAETIEKIILSGGTVNIDSNYDLNIVRGVADRHKDMLIAAGLRCNFDINDGVTSRFGLDIKGKEFKNALETFKYAGNLKLKGLHCHFAARNIETWPARAKTMIELAQKYFSEPPEYIGMGGGLYGKMGESLKKQFDSRIPSYDEYAEAAASPFRDFYGNSGAHGRPKLFIEPGSALAGDAMKFAAKVVDIKDVRGKKIATLSGSVYNINPTLNKKNPPITVYHNSSSESQNEYCNLDFGGYTCIESDYLYRGFDGKLAIGDYVVFDNVGSYSVVLKPPFILPNFAIVDYDDETDKAVLAKKRECFEDLFNTFVF